MLRRMLIALDRTPSGVAAVDWALDWAGRTGALLIGLAVVPEPVIRRPEPVSIGGSHFKARRDTALVAHAHTAVHELLARFEARCAAAGVSYQAVARTGVPLTEITREAHGVDLVVAGRNADFLSLRPGANSDLGWLLRPTPRPVLAVPEHASYGSGVLVVYDGSVRAARALYAFTYSGLVEHRQPRPGAAPARGPAARRVRPAHALYARPPRLPRLSPAPRRLSGVAPSHGQRTLIDGAGASALIRLMNSSKGAGSATGADGAPVVRAQNSFQLGNSW